MLLAEEEGEGKEAAQSGENGVNVKDAGESLLVGQQNGQAQSDDDDDDEQPEVLEVIPVLVLEEDDDEDDDQSDQDEADRSKAREQEGNKVAYELAGNSSTQGKGADWLVG